MDRIELLEIIAAKKKGKEISTRSQAELMHLALELGEEILANEVKRDALNKEISSAREIIGEIKMYFPVLYREIRREFLKPKLNEQLKG